MGNRQVILHQKPVLERVTHLSPYIFILCMESLFRQLRHMQRIGSIKGLKVARSAPILSHLFFADDAIFFLKHTLENVWNTRNVLEKFCILSSQMINHRKSYSVLSKNSPRKFVRLMSKGLKVQVKDKLGTYLGCPMDVDGRSLNTFQGSHHKVSTIITSWKFNTLNQAGKLILINSILAVYASHVITTFLFPKKVVKMVTSSFLRF